MKKLINMSFDIAISSILASLVWFILSLTIDRNLVNIFIISYPIQSITAVIKSGLSVGANICSIKEKNKNELYNGMFWTAIISFIIFGYLIINIEKYLIFMNVDLEIYKYFTIYFILQTCCSQLLNCYINKLYFVKENKKATKILFWYNIITFISIVISSCIFTKYIVIIAFGIVPSIIYASYYYFKAFEKFKIKFNFIKYYKYDLEETITKIFFFMMYLFGISTVYEFGTEYALALTFVMLVTDVLWDILAASTLLAKITITNKEFNYKYHKKITYQLLMIILFSGFLTYLILYRFYQVSLTLVCIYYLFELISFLLYPIYKTKTVYLLLEHNVKIVSINKLIASIVRVIVSLLYTPFCTVLGLIVSIIYQTITITYLFSKSHKIDANGNIINKKEIVEKKSKYKTLNREGNYIKNGK